MAEFVTIVVAALVLAIGVIKTAVHFSPRAGAIFASFTSRRAVVWTGVISLNCTLYLMIGLMGWLQIPATEPLPFLYCLFVAVLIGGYFAAAMADEAKFRQCFIAGLYILPLALASLAFLFAVRIIELTKSKPGLDLTSIYLEWLYNYFTNWGLIGFAGAGFAIFLAGGMLERGITAIARSENPPDRWTYKTAAGGQLDAFGPWRHPSLSVLWRLTGWFLILSCWVPLLLVESWLDRGFGCLNFLVLGQLCHYQGKKRTAPSARRALGDSANPPIVYLRSFRDDGRKVREGAWHDYTNGVFALLTGTVEERLAKIMRRFGPFVAIGKPGEELPEMGAARMYVSDAQWQALVSDLLNKPGTLVVVQAGETQGLRWELSRIRSDLRPEKVLLFLPFGLWNNRRRGDKLYAGFRAWAEKCLLVKFPDRLRGSCFIYFSAEHASAWRAHVLRPREPIDPRLPLLPILKTLRTEQKFFPKWFSLGGIFRLLFLAFLGLLFLVFLGLVLFCVISTVLNKPVIAFTILLGVLIISFPRYLVTWSRLLAGEFQRKGPYQQNREEIQPMHAVCSICGTRIESRQPSVGLCRPCQARAG